MEAQSKALEMPGLVIIDLAQEVQQFRLMVGTMKTMTCIDETMCRIMAKIENELEAEAAIKELGEDIIHEHRRIDADLEGEVYSRAAMLLGTRVLTEVRHCQLYMPDGTLNYYFHSWLRDTTIILHEGSPIEIGGETNELAK